MALGRDAGHEVLFVVVGGGHEDPTPLDVPGAQHGGGGGKAGDNLDIESLQPGHAVGRGADQDHLMPLHQELGDVVGHLVLAGDYDVH